METENEFDTPAIEEQTVEPEVEEWRKNPIFQRPDGSFIIVQDDAPYHVPNGLEEWAELYEKVAVHYEANEDCRSDHEMTFEKLQPKPELTPEEETKLLQQQYTDMIQRMLDTEAKALGYDHCNSVCTYVNTGVQKFDDEGAAFRAWRSAVWAKGYELLAEVQAGTRPIPTKEELIELLPKLEIVYSVTDATDGQ